MNSHRVLVVGVGSIGERHVRCFGRTDRCDVSICEINESLRQTIADRYAIGSAFGNLDDALNDPSDAAVICVPAHLHIRLATKLAEAGVHLLIEKPLSTSFEGIDRLFSLVQEKNLTAHKAAFVWLLCDEKDVGGFGEFQPCFRVSLLIVEYCFDPSLYPLK